MTASGASAVPVRRRRSRLTVQGWLTLVLVIMGVVVLTGVGVGAVLLHLTNDRSDRLIDAIQPARASAYRLQAALVDQESAVRGYAIAADRQFLEPYTGGLETERREVAEMRDLLGDNSTVMADLDAVERAGASWRQTFAEPLVAGVVPGSPKLVDSSAATEGKADFDRIRSLFDRQNDDLSELRSSVITDLDGLRGWRDAVLIGTIIAFFVTAVLLAALTRVAVTSPLERLAAACRRITAGNFAGRIDPEGPKDIFDIATDVEAMRTRILEELASSQDARRLLVRQAEHLDSQAIELRRSNAELEQFAYVASHDLQEPLRKVASFCQLLDKRYHAQLDERGQQYIDFAVDGARRMQTLINDLLTFSRVGRQSAAHTDIDLDAVVQSALADLSTAITESGARIEVPKQALPHITGDRTLLVMLLQNLIGNAIKFRSPDRTPEIVIACDGEEAHGEPVFTVTDNGIGIAEEFTDKVFVIFQRLHGRDAYSGTGIGLAMCRKIVEHHGGKIWIDTGYTGGTRFCFTLPGEHRMQAEVAVLEGTP